MKLAAAAAVTLGIWTCVTLWRMVASECTVEMRQFVDPTVYYYCRSRSGFTFDGSMTASAEAFCVDGTCEALADQLNMADGLDCLDVPALQVILNGNNTGEMVNCSDFDTDYDFSILPMGTIGKCTKEMRRAIGLKHYRSCRRASGFTFGGGGTNRSAFCGNVDCRNIVDQLRVNGAEACFDEMTDVISITDDGLTLDCEAVDGAPPFTMLPMVEGTTCTIKMKEQTDPVNYRQCFDATGFAPNDEDSVVDPKAFCESCSWIINDFLATDGGACLEMAGLEEIVTKTKQGTIVDCTAYGISKKVALPVGDLGACTAEMRESVLVTHYHGCQVASGFAFDGSADSISVKDFCLSPSCLDMVSDLKTPSALVCLDVAGMSSILTPVDHGLAVDCSRYVYTSYNDFTLLPAGTVDGCTEEMRSNVTLSLYQSCHSNSDFTLNSTSPLTLDTFCQSTYCQPLVNQLQTRNATACLKTNDLSSSVKISDGFGTVVCPNGLDIIPLPTAQLGSCTADMRSKVAYLTYRACYKDSRFTFNGLNAVDTTKFCQSDDCHQVYDALVLTDGTICLEPGGLKGNLTVIDSISSQDDDDWCTFTAITDGEHGNTSSSNAMGTGAAIGIVLGAVLLVMAAVLYVWWKRKQLAADKSGTQSMSSLWEDPANIAARIPLEKITFGKVISQGGFGQVSRGEYRNIPVAVKTLLPERSKDMEQIEGLLAEVRIMAIMEHPRIVQFIGVAWDSIKELCIVLEFVPGGDLRTVLTKFEDPNDQLARPRGFDADKTRIAFHVAHALVYMHTLQPMVLHRDLKSRNILLDNELNAKVTDFGVSREHAGKDMTVGVGTSLWMAPEVMTGNQYDEKADVFSFGVVLSELDTHLLPYNDVTESGNSRRLPDAIILQMVADGRVRTSFSGTAEDCAVTGLGIKCTSVNPDDRPSSAEVLHCLHKLNRKQHPPQ